jgi:8-oxo-dGTP pyrophosphatase MutT (NUDIX family)
MSGRGNALDIVVAGYLTDGERVILIHHKKLNQWLPFGGHIEKDEIPDDTLRREAEEELGVKIEFIHYPQPRRGNQRKYASPFYQNKHRISEEHAHYCLFYLCKLKSGEIIKPNLAEMKEYRWIGEEDLARLDPPLDEGGIATCREALRLARG